MPNTQEQWLLRPKIFLNKAATSRRTWNSLITFVCFLFSGEIISSWIKCWTPQKYLLICKYFWCLQCFSHHVSRFSDFSTPRVKETSFPETSFTNILDWILLTKPIYWKLFLTLHAMEGRISFNRTLHLVTKLWWPNIGYRHNLNFLDY